MSGVSPEDPNEIDPLPKNSGGGGEEEDDDDHSLKPFVEYCKPDNLAEILDKRWGMFSLYTALVYTYHFLTIIIGMDKFVHYSRFTGCAGATDFKEASAVYDGIIMAVLVFHIIEWIRQTILVTSILVGVPWVPIYLGLSLNIPFGIIICIVATVQGFASDESCIRLQPGRAVFLQFQLLTLFLYMMWCMHPILILKLGDLMFKPSDTDE